MATTEPRTTGVWAEDLQPLLDGRYGSLRRQIRDVLRGADFNPPIAVPGRDEACDLLDRESQLELFWWREGHITAGIAQRFRRGLDEDYDPFEVFRAVQNHAATAARARMERVVLEAFAAAVERTEPGPVGDALSRLCDLYALYQVEIDRGYLQEHGRLTGPRCKAVTRAVNRLCDEIRRDSEALVDAFGIPDEVLRAPIAVR
jgi:acyl-CoA oxidase